MEILKGVEVKNPFLLLLREKSFFTTIQRKILSYYYSEKNLFGELAFKEKSSEKKIQIKIISEKPPITKETVYADNRT